MQDSSGAKIQKHKTNCGCNIPHQILNIIEASTSHISDQD